MNSASGLRVIAVLLILFVLVSSGFVLNIEALSAEDVAVSAVNGAEQAVTRTYRAVLEAESAGADVSGLLERLDVAARYLALARICLRIGDFDGAVGNASFCVETLDRIVDDAGVLRDRAVRELGERSWMAIGGSIVGVVAVVCVGFLGWNLFKKRYYERTLKMKPEVVDGES